MRLADWRNSKGWTQAEAAERGGFDQVSWSRWETGARTPTLETARRIVTFTEGQVTFEELIPPKTSPDTSSAGG